MILVRAVLSAKERTVLYGVRLLQGRVSESPAIEVTAPSPVLVRGGNDTGNI